MENPKLNLKSFDEYKNSSIKNLKWQLQNFFEDYSGVTVDHVREKLKEINAYENIAHLEPLRDEHIVVLDEDNIDILEAEEVVLNGEFFWEHAAAGEATRLGIGTKYLLNLHDFSLEQIKDMILEEIARDFKGDSELMKEKMAEVTNDSLIKQMGCKPEDILDISLGTRHMLQMAYDINKLANKYGVSVEEVIAKQKLLIVVNEKTSEEIIIDFVKNKFFGFNRETVFFMIQKSFSGIEINKGAIFYDESHEAHKRLHNHGNMVMQKTHDDSVFVISEDLSRKYLNSKEFELILQSCKDLISYNIEDIGYLTNSIDWYSMALALELGKKGYGMVMEIVAQNPLRPQKGGAAFWDKKLGRVVMIESNRLKDIKNEEIKHLNKNFNHYPNPAYSFEQIQKKGLHLHVDVKKMKDSQGADKHYIYFCPPQGDINFIVKTAYVMRKNLKSIANWKSPMTTPPTIRACFEQDNQAGFREFAEKVIGKKL